MADIRQFKLLSGEHVIATFVEVTEDGDELYSEAIQVLIVPDYSDHNKTGQKIGFSPFPEISNPNKDPKFTVNPKNIVYRMTEVDPDYLEQYSKIFSKIVAPTSKIFTGK